MSVFVQRIKLGRRHIFKKATEWTATIFAVAGVVSLFAPFEGVFVHDIKFICKLLVTLSIIAGVWLICAIIQSIIVGCLRKKKVVDGLNGKGVYVLYGDLFDPSIVDGSKRCICFAVNRCFDTVVNDRLITSTSVHGIAFKDLYKKGLYTPESLNEAIQVAIHADAKYANLEKKEKPEGNLKRYDVGTYANLSICDDLNYLLLGMSWLDNNLNAKTPLPDFAYAVQVLVEMFDKESQGFPVLMPIIGAGRSRTELTEREALEYIIEAFKINQRKITSDVFIVVYEKAKDRVSIADL